MNVPPRRKALFGIRRIHRFNNITFSTMHFAPPLPTKKYNRENSVPIFSDVSKMSVSPRRDAHFRENGSQSQARRIFFWTPIWPSGSQNSSGSSVFASSGGSQLQTMNITCLHELLGSSRKWPRRLDETRFSASPKCHPDDFLRPPTGSPQHPQSGKKATSLHGVDQDRPRRPEDSSETLRDAHTHQPFATTPAIHRHATHSASTEFKTSTAFSPWVLDTI